MHLLEAKPTSVEDMLDKVIYHLAKSYQFYIAHTAEKTFPCFLQTNKTTEHIKTLYTLLPE